MPLPPFHPSIPCPLPPAPSVRPPQGVVLNGDEASRYWGNVNLSFAYVEGESLLMGLKVGVFSFGFRA